MRGVVRAAAALALAACAAPIEISTPAPPGPAEVARHRAALATIRVDNRTPQPLAIAFRAAAEPGNQVGIGTAGAGVVEVLAPVPAGEPIIFIARTADGRALEHEAHTLEVDEVWTWVIPAEAVFR